MANRPKPWGITVGRPALIALTMSAPSGMPGKRSKTDVTEPSASPGAGNVSHVEEEPAAPVNIIAAEWRCWRWVVVASVVGRSTTGQRSAQDH